MPTTYNGIGTKYYGKNNLEIRPGTCRSCGRSVQLQSYDTRLWFVIVYIPIIPLGRKRILDFCPACRRHYAPDLEQWETARQLEVSGALDKFRSNPTPENAIAAHQQMLAFHQVPEATEFQKTMLEKFSDSAKIHAYLGSAQDHIGRRDQAAESYKRALELRPDLPEARIGIARGYIREGRLDEARTMLGFLEKSGSAQLYSLEPLETLAYAYQSRGQHQEALDLFGKLMEELPKIVEHPAFRKAVKKSEKAVNRAPTMLPKQKFSLKRMFQSSGRGGRPLATTRGLLVLGALAALVILVFGISNEYIRHHRKIYLVNGYDAPATVEISGVGVVKNFRGVQEMPLPEGRFHAVITGPVKREELDFEVRDGYFSRWSSDRLWLINVGGGALLELSETTYSEHPQPPAVSFYVGRTFEQFPTVTHPFTPLPETVQIESGGTRTLVGLERFKGDATDVAAYYEKHNGLGDALTLAETWLGAHPEDESMLRFYESGAERGKQINRADGFLRSGFTNRPVRIEWHRVYQNLHHNPTDRAALLSQYDEMLASEPTNSALLYLRGRLEASRAVARDYFTRAADADPRNPYAAFALGYDRVTAADWTAARPFLAHASELDPRDVGFANLLFVDRIALGEAPAIEQELRKRLVRDPMDYLAELELHDALAAQGKSEQALMASDNFAALCRSRYGLAGDQLATDTKYHAYYAIADFDKLKASAAADDSTTGRMTEAIALIEQGKVDEAAKALPSEMDMGDRALFFFALTIAYHENGNEMAAARWRSRGIETLQKGGEDEMQAASLLTRTTPPTRAEAENVAIPPQLKAVILTVLSQEYPQARSELAGFARELNVERGFPHHIVQRVASVAQ